MKASIIKTLWLLIAVPLIGGASLQSEDIDLATGLSPALQVSVPIPEPEGGKQLAILWDLTHGVYLSYEPTGYFSELSSVLSGAGFGITTTTAGVQNIDLTIYDVVVINLTSSWNSAYMANEVVALVDYVNQGGGLLIMGANDGCPNGNINPVSIEFGTTCGGNSSEPSDLFFTNFISHDIFDGITSLYFRATGVLYSTSPSIAAALSPTYSEILISIVDPSPRVVIMGTCTGWSNNYFYTADNVPHAINVFTWLSGYPMLLEHNTWGSIKAAID